MILNGEVTQSSLKVLIVGYYGFENAGDEAILWAIVSDLRTRRPDISITVVSGNPAKTAEKHGVSAISWHDGFAVFDAVSEADLTIVGGGGLFHDYWGLNPNHFLTDRQSGIVFFAAPAILAALMGKPLMLYAVGVGPLLSGHAKRFTRVVCEAATAITVRDEGSRQLLESIGVDGGRITVTADPAFGLPVRESYQAIADLPRPVVGVSVRNWDFGVESNFWEPELAAGLDRFLAKEGGTVVFLALGRLPGKREDDRAVAERVQSRMARRDATIVLSQDLGPDELLGAFRHCDLTVGMRLHSLIFSAMNIVPCVALSYDPKVDWFMERIGSTDVIEIRSIEADALARMMSEALARTDEFHAAVSDKVHLMADLARQNADICLTAIEHQDRRAGYWPAPELADVLARGLRGQLQAAQSLKSELQNLSDVLARVEADRDEGRAFLTNEKRLLELRLEEVSSALANAQTDNEHLRTEVETVTEIEKDRQALREELKKAGEFQRDQNEALAEVEKDRQALREELGKAAEFQGAQEQSLSNVEADRTRLRAALEQAENDRQAVREELRKAGDFQVAQQESLARIDADRTTLRAELQRAEEDRQALREELERTRQLQRDRETEAEAAQKRLLTELEDQRKRTRINEDALSKLQAEHTALALGLKDAIANGIRLEVDRDSTLAQLSSLTEKLRENEERLGTEHIARDGVERELARSQALLQKSNLARQAALTAIEQYRKRFERELSLFRSQRAWKAMLYLRGAYTLLVRKGWSGLPGFVKLTVAGGSNGSRFDEYELRFPEIDRYLPEPGLAEPVVVAEETQPQICGPSQWNKYDLVILGIIDFDFRFQRPQQIAAQFARCGHRVFWISPSRFIPPSADQPYEIVPLRENIWEVHLRGPQPDVYLGRLNPPDARALTASLERLFRDQAIAENLLLLQLPFWRQLGLAVREKFGSVLAYDCMDDWETFENMGTFNVLEEKSLAVECDVLIVTGQGLVDKFKARGIDSLLARNGADFDFFARARSTNLLAGIPRPVVGYFGAIADWIDLDLIRDVAATRPQYSFVLIGQVFGREMAELERLPNVYLLGNQKYESIPSFLSDFDACTIPFLLNQVTKATDPVKIYEYLSQGKPVIATDMMELAQCGDMIYIGRDGEDFARKVDAALSEADTGMRARRIEFARLNTWARRVEAIDARVRREFPLVSILIVAHNSAEFVAPCLESIRDATAYPAYEVIVLDNASSDATAEIVGKYAEADERVRIIRLTDNTGFAAGNNLAARKASSEYLIMLNVDTVVTPGWIERMLRHVRRDRSIGIICPVTNFAGNEIKINVDYADARQMRHFALKVAREEQGRTTDIDVAPLYCALIPRRVWAEAGELDEGFGLGMYEDDDFSVRVRRAGYRVTVAEDCFIHHFGQGSFSKMRPEEYEAIFESNRKRFEEKWKVAWKPHRTRPGVRPAFEERRFTPAEFYQNSEF